jgi:hypothetical protein
MITDFEKYIYNTHLKATRQHKNQPYKLRKDFDDLDEKDKLCLKKLSSFFNKHKEISPNTFFSASYKIFSDETFLDLSFFLTLKAIKAYTIHNKNISNLDPDSEEQLIFTKNSLKFIFLFCQENKISIPEYISHKTKNIFSFVLHLKNREVNIYSLFGFDNFSANIKKSDLDVLKFMFDESLLEKINTQKIKFLNSYKCKSLVINGLQKLSDKLKNELIS